MLYITLTIKHVNMKMQVPRHTCPTKFVTIKASFYVLKQILRSHQFVIIATFNRLLKTK